jgi:branched-chain amino acid transport system ATP-binding protein
MLTWEEGKQLLEIKNLSVSYGDVPALKHLSFSVREKSIVTLVGANAAGKTTTIKTISGLVPAKEGEIWFEGEKIDNLPAFERVSRGIVQVPEGRRVFPYMNVHENLLIGAYSKKARVKIKDTLDYVYSLFPILQERSKQMAGTLSGGQQQMLAIGRGLMSLPKIIMLDEPSLGLAPVIVTQMFTIIKEINEQGMTILLVEQNVHQSLKLSDYAYVVENGELVMEGKAIDLSENPDVIKAYIGLSV